MTTLCPAVDRHDYDASYSTTSGVPKESTLRSVGAKRTADATGVHIRIVSHPLDPQCLRVDLNNVQKYTLVSVPHHFHEWLLVGERNRPLARFRASRILWWIHLYTMDIERPPLQLHPNLSCGIGRMEWNRQGYGTLRLNRANLTITRVRGSNVELPELAVLGALPNLPAFAHNHIDYSIYWRPDNSEVTAPIVIITSFIAMWRWSRQTPLLSTLKCYIVQRLQRWMQQNVQSEHLHKLGQLGIELPKLRAAPRPQNHLISTTPSIRSARAESPRRTARSPRQEPAHSAATSDSVRTRASADDAPPHSERE